VMTPAGVRGLVNDAIAIYFLDVNLATALVARWCVGHKVEMSKGAYRVRENAPTPRVHAAAHRTPREPATRRIWNSYLAVLKARIRMVAVLTRRAVRSRPEE
jgi:hypothetical protein